MMKKLLLYSFFATYLMGCTTTKSTFTDQSTQSIGGVNAILIKEPNLEIKRSFLTKVVTLTPIAGGIAWGATSGKNIELENSKTGKMEKIGEASGIVLGGLIGLFGSYVFSAASPKDKTVEVGSSNYGQWVSKQKNLRDYYVRVNDQNYRTLTFLPKSSYVDFFANSAEEVYFYKGAFGDVGSANFIKKTCKSKDLNILNALSENYRNSESSSLITYRISEITAYNKVVNNGVEGCVKFASEFKNSEFIPEIETLMFKKAKTLSDYKTILKGYPKLGEKAENMAFEMVNKDADITLKQNYTKNFSKGKNLIEQQIKELEDAELKKIEIARIEEEKAQMEAQKVAEQEKLQEKEHLALEKIENEKAEVENKKRQAQIMVNSNPKNWSKGDKICVEMKNGILMGTIDDWNENRSKSRIKIVAGPLGIYEGEKIKQGDFLWVSTSGKNWHLCLDDELQNAVANDKSNVIQEKVIQETAPSANQNIDTRAVARYTRSFARFLQNKCGKGETSTRPDIEIKKTEMIGDDYLIHIEVTWVEGSGSMLLDVFGARKKRKFSGVLLADMYGCKASMMIQQSNEDSFFGFSCLQNVPEKDVDRTNTSSPFYNCTKYIYAGCLDE